MQPQMLEVIAGVDDHCCGGAQQLNEPVGELGAFDASSERHNHARPSLI
jgi:hypothetical protein